ncbi:MAG: penicillin acylase family protein [Gammaproteobacteria bacterium]|nr:penicillin acylase family protein [Gammaproteobacteria bacterium]
MRKKRKPIWRWLCQSLGLFSLVCSQNIAAAPELASEVVIHRDEWGVPHVRGESDAAVVFGSAWAQCEDHFWQLEDTYIRALGRSAEVFGEKGLPSDLDVVLFDIVGSAQRDFPSLPQEIQDLASAFAEGYNFYLERHPEVTPRLVTNMQPWHVLAYERYMILPRLLGAAHAPSREIAELASEYQASLGSNQWAIGPERTRDGTAMLFINPHQPWYGSGMFTEMHVKSDSGWDFSGAMFPGSPFPTAGFNDRLGWAYTVNQADIADLYRLTFNHPNDPDLYRYGTDWRRAHTWQAEIKVLVGGQIQTRRYLLRRSHYGPIIKQEDDVHFLAARVPRLYDGSRMVQALAQARAQNFDEWYAAASSLQLQTFNTMYADADGNIFYLYNGTVAKRKPGVDWTRPVNGADPELEWDDFHPIEELPQVLNPPSAFMQNCNSTPFTTTDDGNPSMKDFPVYMVEDRTNDNRRAKLSRWLLRQARDVTFEDWQQMAYNTTLYWPMTELPRYRRRFAQLEVTHPELAARVEPLLNHLLDWDYRSTLDSTQTTLAVEWYEQLYGRGYPVETLKPEFIDNIPARFQALVQAAQSLEARHGSWQVPYGETHRIQRHAPYSSAADVPFDDRQPSLGIAGVRGPLGVAFTVYHTPPTDDPNRQKQYAVTGSSYKAVYEFRKEGVRAASYLHYGQSHDPTSAHFFDQAELLSERRFKPAWFAWSDVVAHTQRAYRPGD